MVLEAIIFSIIIVISLVFLFQLSPSPTLYEKYSNTLKVKGDDALRSVYKENQNNSSGYPIDYPSNKLTYYMITNNYTNFTYDLNNILPNTVMFNIWIGNGIRTIFWCNSFGQTTTRLQPVGSVTTAHYLISIAPSYRTNETGFFLCQQGKYYDNRSDLDHPSAFQGYEGSTYDVILEMWYIT